MQKIDTLNFYDCAIIGTSQIFTYQSTQNFKLYSIVEVPLKKREVRALIVQKVKKPSFECLDILKLIYELNEKEKQIVNFISYYYVCSLGEAVNLFTFQKNGPLQKMETKTSINLTPPQQKALEFCQKNRVAILFGDTGSGKTEIYLKFIEKVLNENKTALFLLPEIAITAQMEKRLKKHFGELVAIWHSKVTKKRKEKILEEIKEGKIRVIAGARSALFLPLNNLGVIIVDEFHDESYKSQNGVRYNAKDLAIYFGKVYHANVVLGSATPLVSDIYKHPHFRLRGNFYNTKNNLNFVSSFDEVIPRIEKSLQENNQVIIFIPTRANFKYTICQGCGKAIKCPFCDVAMSIHSKEKVMRCHYCNFSMPIPEKCPSCSAENFVNERMGSSEVVEVLKNLFSQKRVEKFDRDTITSKKRLDKILKEFQNKKIDVLVGTQMLSKGHDYDVQLAVILDIDFILNIPDYRARERALSLVVQVSGRAGRRKNGEVLIQTQNEEFFKQSYDEFIQEELLFRKMLNYPPFSRLARLEFIDKKLTVAKKEMLKVKECLEKEGCEILGYGPSPILKIANKYRFQILIKGLNFHKFIWKCKTEKTKVDIDVMNFT